MGAGAGFYVHGDLDRTKRRRKQHKAFDKNQRYYKDHGDKKTFQKATKIQLMAIREKIAKDRRIENRKTVLAFVLGIPIAIVIFKFIAHLCSI